MSRPQRLGDAGYAYEVNNELLMEKKELRRIGKIMSGGGRRGKAGKRGKVLGGPFREELPGIFYLGWERRVRPLIWLGRRKKKWRAQIENFVFNAIQRSEIRILEHIGGGPKAEGRFRERTETRVKKSLGWIEKHRVSKAGI